MFKLHRKQHASKSHRSSKKPRMLSADQPTLALSRAFRGASKVVGQIHHFKRSFSLAGNCTVDGSLITATAGQSFFTMSSSTSVPQFGWILIQPKLSQFPNSGEFTSLFDEYRIVDCVVKMTPYQTVSAMTDASSFGTSTNSALIHSAIDYDGNTALSFSTTSDLNSLGVIRQYDSYRMAPFFRTDGKSYTVRCPAPAVLTDSSGTGQVVHSPWLNQTNNGVYHNGIFIMVEMFSSTATPSQTIYFKGECTCTLEFRGQY